jgi:hypothetical protein
VHPGDRILNPQPWGSWFELAVPSATVAIDSRIEVFPPAVWNDYSSIASGGPGWEATLAHWAPTVAVVARSDTDLADRLTVAGWRKVFGDEDGLVLTGPGR